MRNKKGKSNIVKYLPVLIILLSITIIVGSTFAYFTDRKEETSDLTFSKVELSSETTTGINGVIYDALPGMPLVSGALKFSKSIDSEPIYVRAKLSYSLPAGASAGMSEILDALRSADGYTIETNLPNGAKWSAKEGNYFYLLGNDDNMFRVETIDTYTLTSELVIPRDLEALDGNAQYMESINFHIAFEAIQADNIGIDLTEIKELFNKTFPESENEKVPLALTIKNSDNSVIKVVKYSEGEYTKEPIIELAVDENGTSIEAIDGWYSDSNFTLKYSFGENLTGNNVIYPKIVQPSEGLSFSLLTNSNTYSVAIGECDDTVVVVPAYYMGLPVTSVADNFSRGSNITKIVLPHTITTLNRSAFYHSMQLEEINIPEGVTTIPADLFNDCRKLKGLEVPSTVTSIGMVNPVRLCPSLEYLKVHKANEYYNDGNGSNCIIKTSNGLLLSGCQNTVIPYGVTSINRSAFEYCEYLKSIVLPDTVTSIGDCGFSVCRGLESITLSNNLQSIGELAFQSCENLNSITLPGSLTTVEDYAFSGCHRLVEVFNLSSLDLETECADVAYYALRTSNTVLDTNVFVDENDFVFYYGSPNEVYLIGYKGNETRLVLPTNYNGYSYIINEYAFYNYENLVVVETPGTLTSIGVYAFDGCEGMQLLTLGGNITSIGTSAFSYSVNIHYVLCETDAVASLASGKGRSDTYIYSLQSSGYSGLTETAVVISDSVTIYTATDASGYKWVRTADNKYYKCIVTG